MGLLILYLAIALFFSFFCSLLEAALLSTSPIYINIKIKENKKYAHSLQNFKRKVPTNHRCNLHGPLEIILQTIHASRYDALDGFRYLNILAVLV